MGGEVGGGDGGRGDPGGWSRRSERRGRSAADPTPLGTAAGRLGAAGALLRSGHGRDADFRCGCVYARRSATWRQEGVLGRRRGPARLPRPRPPLAPLTLSPFFPTSQAALLGKLSGEVLSRRASATSSSAPPEEVAAALSLSASLLELVPDVHTGWNLRRELALPTLLRGGAEAVRRAREELAVSAKAIARNPKSYCAWHHRRWVVSYRYSSLEEEMALVEKLLTFDARNFHAWGYRLFVAERMGLPVERELAFTLRKIEENFSNYSAWHYRTKLLPLKHGYGEQDQGAEAARGEEIRDRPEQARPRGEKGETDPGQEDEEGKELEEATTQTPKETSSPRITGPSSSPPSPPPSPSFPRPVAGLSSALASPQAPVWLPIEVLAEEFALVRQALYTEPKDSSAWVYHRWLLACLAEGWRGTAAREEAGEAGEAREAGPAGLAGRPDPEALAALLEDELVALDEIVELEPQARAAVLASARVQELARELEGSLGEASGAGQEADRQARRQACAALAEIDPMRSGMYADMAAGKAAMV